MYTPIIIDCRYDRRTIVEIEKYEREIGYAQVSSNLIRMITFEEKQESYMRQTLGKSV